MDWGLAFGEDEGLAGGRGPKFSARARELALNNRLKFRPNRPFANFSPPIQSSNTSLGLWPPRPFLPIFAALRDRRLSSGSRAPRSGASTEPESGGPEALDASAPPREAVNVLIKTHGVKRLGENSC